MSYATRALAVASALLMGAPAALAHTNSIGYVGSGNGTVTFWYGNWHSGTNFNEGTLTLQGINGNTFAPTTVNWSLISATTPDGLIPGINYFTSDGTQLVPYDTNIQTSYAWQGVTFTGLAAGDYQFTYNAAGSPTVNWMPMDNIILSSTVSLSAAALSGDANQNGVLDIYETGGTPPSPTLVSSNTVNNVSLSVSAPTYTSNTIITRTNSESNGKQTLNFDAATTVTATIVTTTTTTPVTTDTYSDNSTVVTNGTPVVTTSSSSQSAVSNQYADFSGRIDQLEVLGGINNGINELLNHEPSKTRQKFRVFENNRLVQSYNADGYFAKSTIFGGGFELDLSKGWTVGFQYNSINLDMVGVDSITRQKKDHFGIFNTLHGNAFTLNTNAAIANSKYNYARTLEYAFGNYGETTGTEWWVSNRLYWHLSKNVKPFVGHTVQNVRRNAYTETGSVESVRTVAEHNQATHIGEAGLKLETRFGGKRNDLFGVSVEGAYATDNSYDISSSIDYKKVLFIEGSHRVNDGVTNNSVTAKVKFRF